jgi:hypothetical protein
MLLVGVKTAALSLDAASQAWSEICTPGVGQKTARFFGSWAATCQDFSPVTVKIAHNGLAWTLREVGRKPGVQQDAYARHGVHGW